MISPARVGEPRPRPGAGRAPACSPSSEYRERPDRLHPLRRLLGSGCRALCHVRLLDRRRPDHPAQRHPLGQVDGTFVDPPQEADAEAAGLVIRRQREPRLLPPAAEPVVEPFASLRGAPGAEPCRRPPEPSWTGCCSGSATRRPELPEGYLAFDEETGTGRTPSSSDKAGELLETAGYADGFEFEMIVPTIPQILQFGEIVQAQLARSASPPTSPRSSRRRPATSSRPAPGQRPRLAVGRPSRPTLTLQLQFGSEGFSNPGRHTHAGRRGSDRHDEGRAVRRGARRPRSRPPLPRSSPTPRRRPAHPITPGLFTDQVLGIQTWLSGKPSSATSA